MIAYRSVLDEVERDAGRYCSDARGWVLVFAPGNSIFLAVLCAECAASHPEPALLPPIARLILWRSRGPLQ
jgi:hypothetical protein